MAIGLDDQRDVQIARRGDAQQFLQIELARGVVQQVGAAERLGQLFYLVIAVSFGQGAFQRQVLPRFARMLNDLPIQMRAHQSDLVSVLPCRHADGRPHHSRTHYRNHSHKILLLFFSSIIISEITRKG
ncbi:hypothetical protein SDC9_180692 [bioreactor metagenome]|uniref:Uncharacterized protein n=1 Tax=bioreactor metagenome TaxID=1076179 RepID=A0A645H2H0_9ZZZZ